MAIEGPLRELDIHDVFQLLDLSRKTGTLHVSSELRDNAGTVLFEKGRVVAATIRSNPHRLGDMLLRSGKVTDGDIARARAVQRDRGDRRRLGEILVEIGALAPKELERQVRLHIEAVVFELLSWSEGFFRFEEGPVASDSGAMIQISTESLMMEGARRIDEWSRLVERVPGIEAIPHLVPADGEHASQLDLLPTEWEVLTMIDGERDLRAISAQLARSEFDTAKVVYGLVTTGIVEVRMPAVTGARHSRASIPATPPERRGEPSAVDDELDLGYQCLERGNFDGAVKAWAHFLRTHPDSPMAARVREGVAAARTLRTMMGDRPSE